MILFLRTLPMLIGPPNPEIALVCALVCTFEAKRCC